MTTFAYGSTVTLVTRTVSGQDAYGNDVFTETQTIYENVPVWANSSTETVQGQDMTVTGMSAFLPAGVDVSNIDAVLIDGLKYEVMGEPASFTSPFTNMSPGVQLILRRVTG